MGFVSLVPLEPVAAKRGGQVRPVKLTRRSVSVNPAPTVHVRSHLELQSALGTAGRQCIDVGLQRTEAVERNEWLWHSAGAQKTHRCISASDTAPCSGSCRCHRLTHTVTCSASGTRAPGIALSASVLASPCERRFFDEPLLCPDGRDAADPRSAGLASRPSMRHSTSPRAGGSCSTTRHRSPVLAHIASRTNRCAAWCATVQLLAQCSCNHQVWLRLGNTPRISKFTSLTSVGKTEPTIPSGGQTRPQRAHKQPARSTPAVDQP